MTRSLPIALMTGLLLATGCASSTIQSEVALQGDPYAASFTARTPQGEEVRFDVDELGRTAVLLFFQPGCDTCADEMPQLTRLHQSRPDVVIVGIPVGVACHEPLPDAPPFPMLCDPDLKIASLYEVRETPTLVVVTDGRIRYAGHRLPSYLPVNNDLQLAAAR